MAAVCAAHDNRAMKNVVVVGAGPAGLMAAQVLAQAGVAVQVLDAMPSAGRKFLLAGRGGLNLTHSESADAFASRYGQRRAVIEGILADFGPGHVRQWAQALGQPTFVGSSGRVFPVSMKAAPLLRAWLHSLRHPMQGQPVKFLMRHRWLGWPLGQAEPTQLRVEHQGQRLDLGADAVVLALGGGSWPRLGSDGAWVSALQARGVAVAALKPANCGFDVAGGWTPLFVQRFAGQPFKSVSIRLEDAQGQTLFERKGECVVTDTGLEGSVIYAASSLLRQAIEAHGQATLWFNLLPDWSLEKIEHEVAYPRGARSWSNHLKSRLKLDGVKAALLHECLPAALWQDPLALAQAIARVPVVLSAPRPLAEAISSAGGVLFEGLNEGLMVETLPGVFCAGEMLDWEAPTGGYLLTASLASGVRAAQGVLAFLGFPPEKTVRTPV
jgi:hypothetical protein